MAYRAFSPERYHGYRGRELEADLFGVVDVTNPRYMSAFRSVANEKGYVSYKDAMELVRDFQPGGDPRNPGKDFFRELRLAVAEKLGLESDKDLERISCFTSVRTPLDVWHGVDAFIEVQENGGKKSCVTFDATLNPDKVPKADIVVGDLPIAEEDEEGYLRAIDATADDVVKRLRQQAL